MSRPVGNTEPSLEAALTGAIQGLPEHRIPIDTVIVHRGTIMRRRHNRRVQNVSAILHGEMGAFGNAGRQSASVYRECMLYSTLSPCPMCTGTLLLYRNPGVVVGEKRTRMGMTPAA